MNNKVFVESGSTATSQRQILGLGSAASLFSVAQTKKIYGTVDMTSCRLQSTVKLQVSVED